MTNVQVECSACHDTGVGSAEVECHICGVPGCALCGPMYRCDTCGNTVCDWDAVHGKAGAGPVICLECIVA